MAKLCGLLAGEGLEEEVSAREVFPPGVWLGAIGNKLGACTSSLMVRLGTCVMGMVLVVASAKGLLKETGPTGPLELLAGEGLGEGASSREGFATGIVAVFAIADKLGAWSSSK